MMTKSARRVLRAVVISLVALAISRTGVVEAATMPVATLQAELEAGLRTPTGLALGADGSVYVADPANRGVLKYSAAGARLQKVSVKGIPQGVAVTADGRILVSQREYVGIYSAAGVELGRLGSGAGQFVQAGDIAVDDAGTIYVTDSKAGCVRIFTSAGAYQGQFGVQGTGDGQFRYPAAIAYEKVGKELAVVDSLNGRVQFYQPDGTYVRAIGSNGTGPLKFMHPKGVAFEYGANNSVRMYVSDAMLRTIQAIDPTGSGTFLSYVGRTDGHGSPTDLAFDSGAERLYVINGRGSVAVYGIKDGNEVVTAAPGSTGGSATVITSNATGSVATGGTTTGAGASPLVLSAVSDGSVVTGELLDLTGVVTGNASVSVNGLPLVASNGLVEAAVPLLPGSNQITVTVSDAGGNSWQEVRTVTRDGSAPQVSVKLADVIATGKGVVSVAGSVDRSAYVTVAGVPADLNKTDWSSQVTLTAGLNTIEIQAIDLNGQAASVKRTVLYQPGAPELAITTPAEDVVSSQGQVTVSGKVSEDAKVTATVNGAALRVSVDDGRFRIPVTLGEAGSYTVVVSASADGKTSTVERSIIYRKAE